MQKAIAALVVLVGVLAGFYGGAKYGSAHSTASASSSVSGTGSGSQAGTGSSPGAGARAGGGTGGLGAPAAAGQIVATADGSITVHDRTTNKDVKVTLGNARISKTVQGTPADLTQSQTVTVVGQTGSDGTVNAQVISIGGSLGGGGGGRARPSPST